MIAGLKRFGFLFLAIFLCAEHGFATITIQSVSNVSAYDAGASILYGGIAGSDTCAASTGLCNSCTLSTLTACNKRRINKATVVTITFTSTVAGYPMLAKDSDGSQVSPGSTSVAAGDTASISIPWSTICSTMTSAADDTCLTDGTSPLNKGMAFKLGISVANDSSLLTAGDDVKIISFQVQRTIADTVSSAGGTSALGSNGIFGFTIFPGDGKVYLENLSAHSNFPVSANGTSYTKIHLLSTKNVTTCLAGNGTITHDVLNNPDRYKTVDLDGAELTDDRFFGYENETSYYFKVALEDRAGNIGNFTADADCTTSHIAMPGEVFGLLRERQNCFIATAAYGSPLDPAVNTFRQFRDQFLVKTSLGRKFVSKYYDFSPKLANIIAENDQLRALSRAALYPLWIFAALSLHYGFLAAVILFSVLILAPLVIFSGIRKGIKT